MPIEVAPPPVKSRFDDPDTKGPAIPWMKWFQALVSFLNFFGTYTPVVTAGSGAFMTVSATGRYVKIGRLVFVQITVTITTNGTAAGNVKPTLPFAAVNVAGIEWVLPGSSPTTGKMLQGIVSPNASLVAIINYDNTYPGGDATTLHLSGFYETAS